MNRFCQECGKKVDPDHKVCIHCGTPLLEDKQVVQDEKQETAQKRVVKKPMSKKQKRMWQIIAGFVVIIIGFSMWANSYHSPEAVQKRFDKAIVAEDTGKLKKVLIHSDATSISESEAKAFLALVKEQGPSISSGVTEVTYAGKFLGIFDKFKIESVDQFVTYDEYLEGLTFTFNGKEVDEVERDGEYVLFGPLAPGIYDVEAIFESEYGDATVEDSITLDSYYPDEYVWLNMEIPIGNVVFYVENYSELDLKDSYVKLADEKLSISEEGETKAIGPILIDGSQKVEVVAAMPWDEVTSDSIAVENSYMNIYADLVSAEDYEKILDVLDQFGEEYVEAMAKKSTKPFSSVSAEGKKLLKNYLSDYYEYTGQYDLLEVDKSSMFIEKDEEDIEVNIQAAYSVQEDFHDIADGPDLYEETYTWTIGLNYHEKDEKWLISAINNAGIWGGIEVTDERKGPGKLYGPNKEAVSKAKDNEFDSELEQFVFDYTSASVEAINYRDFDLVAEYIDSDGPRYKEADEYIDYLDSKDIYEEWYGSEIEKVESIDDDSWEVSVIEEFDIIKPDDSSVKKFRTKLIIKRIDDAFYVNELTATDEI